MLAISGEGDEDGGPRGRVSSGPDIASSLQCNRTSSRERVMGVRNTHYDCQLTRLHRTYDQQCQRELRQMAAEVNKVEYDLKVMQIATRQNDREQKRRENPEADTTYEDMFLQKSAKSVFYNPEDCIYLRKKNTYATRAQRDAGGVSNSVKDARKLLLDHDIKRVLKANRERREALTRTTARTQDEDPNPDLAENPPDPPPADPNAGFIQTPKPTSILVRVKKAKSDQWQAVAPHGPVQSAKTKTKTWLSGLSTTAYDNYQATPSVEDPVFAVAHANKSESNDDTALLPTPRLVRSTSDVTFALNSNNKFEDKGEIVKKPVRVSSATREKRMTACFENLKATVADQNGKIKTNYLLLPLINKKSASPSTEDVRAKEDGTNQPPENFITEDDYDVEERLRELGIIKDKPNPQKNIKIYLPCGSLDGRRLSTALSRVSSVRRLSHPALSRETLQKDGEEIQHRIDMFFDKLEQEKEEERRRKEEAEAAAKAKDRDDEPSALTKSIMKQTNLFTSFRSKVMKEKWKGVKSKVAAIKDNVVNETKPAVTSIDVATPAPTVNSSRISPSRKSSARQIKYGWRTPSPPPNWTIPRSAVPSVETSTYTKKKKTLGVPGRSAERSKRHTATFKLQKMMEQMVANKSKFELMKIEEVKQQITDDVEQPAGDETATSDTNGDEDRTQE